MPAFLEARLNLTIMKEAIICKLFNFSGTNSHLKCLVKYLGKDNVILILEEEGQLTFVDKIAEPSTVRTKVMTGLHPYAHLARSSKLSNLKEALIITGSIIRLLIFCLCNNVRGITINTTEPEKYLYFFWIPFIRVRYIVHSTPSPRFTWFTSFTCNNFLSKRKAIITVSKANKAMLCENWKINPKKYAYISVIYNCVTENKTMPENYRAVEKDRINILTMGHIISYKNPQMWMETAKKITDRFSNVHFIWLGDGPMLDQVKKASSNNERISFPGVIDVPDPWLETAMIYYQPSLYETHGIAVLEAMSYQLPCVVSDIGGLPESVENNVNGILVSPNDLDQHLAAIEKLIVDPALRQAYGQNGYKKCKEHFSFAKFKSEMDKIYLGS